ncbi:YARHG domain-containing protein [Candidatus Gracilibacteria bacterium]|nr:YARHG domain-containing protein [Candidatus Gracilibacteria bacterium]
MNFHQSTGPSAARRWRSANKAEPQSSIFISCRYTVETADLKRYLQLTVSPEANMRRQFTLIVLIGMLAACGASPRDVTFDGATSGYVVLKDVRLEEAINVAEEGVAIFVRITSTASNSGTGATVRYPEDNIVLALTPSDVYTMSPLLQIPNRADVVVEVSAIAVPKAITLEALNLLEFAFGEIVASVIPGGRIGLAVAYLLDRATDETKNSIAEGRLLAYLKTTAPDLASNAGFSSDQMSVSCKTIGAPQTDVIVLQPPFAEAAPAVGTELPFFMTRPVFEADLAGKNEWELDLMRNEIYARYGRRFQRPELQAHFDQQAWYEPRYSPEEFPVSLLSSVQCRNAGFILQYQGKGSGIGC